MPSHESNGLHARWMIRADLDAVLAIENEAFDFPWSRADFLGYLKCRNAMGMVIESRVVPTVDIIGYVIYDLLSTSLHIANMAVREDWRGLGIGKLIIERLIGKLGRRNRTMLHLEVRETNLRAQQFFRSCGFKAKEVLRNHYDNSDEDAYLFQYVPVADEQCRGK